ncbi:T-cell differentiation antigen CD6-like isoform X2 [Myxocyprinus asiaticus]|uniref:T-cell differentiation antigen CD6-like isoform X2 n=1 Tax=Myxocyprinus asiaticus TaxID=70543 RepID=UPI002221D696|nr:T-cell differentiation antigen CD6-like isoform X2 [Myxocyprinus asiaticus]
MPPLLLYIVLQVLSLSQGLNSTDDHPPKSVANHADHSDKQIEPYMLRLSRGCSGVVRALHQNTTVDVTLNLLDSQEKKELAIQICKNLGCGQVFEHGVSATIRNDVCLAGCILRESKLHNCTTAAERDCINATKIICEHQAVRLVGSHDRCAGRVELLQSGQWGTVCDDDFDMRSGNIVCAQLGCGRARKQTFLGAGRGPIHISKMKCNGSESNLWECNRNNSMPSNYCGHKEDAGLVCSESTEISPTTVNTTDLGFITHTAESTAVTSTKPGSGLSAATIGCFILSIALLLFILSNAAVCVHFKRGLACVICQCHSNSHTSTENQSNAQIGTYQQFLPAAGTVRQYECLGPRLSSNYGYKFARRTNQTSHNSDSSDDSIYEYHNSDRVQRLHQNYSHTVDVNDSSSTSSGESYENTKTDMNNIPKSRKETPSLLEKSPLTPPGDNHIPGTNCHVDANDSDSTSSGEWYENKKTDVENNLQSDNEESPSLPEKSLQTPDSDQMTGNTAYSKPHIPISQVYANDSESTSSGECYQNTDIDAKTFLQSGKESPSFPEQTPLNHHSTQMTGSTVDYKDHHVPRNLKPRNR